MRKQACHLSKCGATYTVMIRHNLITIYWFLCIHIPTNIILYAMSSLAYLMKRVHLLLRSNRSKAYPHTSLETDECRKIHRVKYSLLIKKEIPKLLFVHGNKLPNSSPIASFKTCSSTSLSFDTS